MTGETTPKRTRVRIKNQVFFKEDILTAYTEFSDLVILLVKGEMTEPFSVVILNKNKQEALDLLDNLIEKIR